MRLEGKTAIVTGGASGFGAGIARKFAAEGAQVMIVDINHDGAMGMAEELGAGSFGHVANVAVSADVAETVATARQVFGEVDILVNNAGVTHLPKPMEEVSEEEFDRVFAVNCKSVYLFAHELAPFMKQRRAGAILNIASTAGVSPRPNLNWYNASKGWMNTATKAMAVEWRRMACGSMRSTLLQGRRLFWQASWAKTRLRCAQNLFRPFQLGDFRRLKTSAMRPVLCARMRRA